LAAGPNGEIEDRRLQYLALLCMGQITKQRESSQASLPELHRAVELLRGLTAEAPNNRDVRNNFATGLDQLSSIYFEMNELAESERFVRESIDAYQNLLKEFPN